jgi:hypothetical protein
VGHVPHPTFLETMMTTKTKAKDGLVTINNKFREELAGYLTAVQAGKANAAWWTRFEHAEVFLRISRRVMDRQEFTAHEDFFKHMVYCVDIANINMAEKYQRKGTFTRLVLTIHELTEWPIFLENANDHFNWVAHLVINHGWRMHHSTVRVDKTHGQYCLWRPGVKSIISQLTKQEAGHGG